MAIRIIMVVTGDILAGGSIPAISAFGVNLTDET
jgi:hypothetical protein